MQQAKWDLRNGQNQTSHPPTLKVLTTFKLLDSLDAPLSKGLTFKTHLTFWTEHQLLTPSYRGTKQKNNPFCSRGYWFSAMLLVPGMTIVRHLRQKSSFKIFHLCVFVHRNIFCFEQLSVFLKVKEEQHFISLSFFAQGKKFNRPIKYVMKLLMASKTVSPGFSRLD